MQRAVKNNRDRLIEAAFETVQHTGLKGLSFYDLGLKAGIAPSHVYYYFPDKHDLAQALIETYTDSLIETMIKISNRPYSLQQKITLFIAIFENLDNNNQISLGTLLATEADECDQKNLTSINSLFQHTEQWLFNLLDYHSREIKSSLTPEHLASLILTSLEGALAIDRLKNTSSYLQSQKKFILSLL